MKKALVSAFFVRKENMKKFLKKVVTCFCVFSLLFTAVVKPKVVKADGGASVALGGFLAVNPELWPIAAIGVVALVVVGVTINNWDEITAFGQLVADELRGLGYAIGDFVSGTAVKVDGTFKKAAKNAISKLGDTVELPSSLTYHGGLKVFTGSYRGRNSVLLGGTSSLYLGQEKPKGDWLFPSTYSADKDYLLKTITVIVDVEPTKLKLDLYSVNDSGIKFEGKINKVTDSQGNIVQISGKFTGGKSSYSRSIFLEAPNYNDSFTITGVSVPELGIGERKRSVSTVNIRTGALTGERLDRYMDRAFPKTETVTLKKDGEYANVGLLNLPKVSDKTFDQGQIDDLTRLRTGVGANAGVGTIADTGAISTSGSGTVTGVGGLDWLSKLWEWLKKIWEALIGIPGVIIEWLKKLLEAILGIPSAILSGLSALWDWLAKILAAIGAIPKAITSALTWTFGLDLDWLKGRLDSLKISFNRKFPAMQPFNFSFQDKSSFDDMYVDLPYIGRQVIVSSSAMDLYIPLVKTFFRGLFYLLVGLFFYRKFYKVGEG